MKRILAVLLLTPSLLMAENTIGLAQESEKSGQYQEAFENYKKAYQKNPESPEAVQGLVRIYIKIKKYDLADKLIQTYLKEQNPFQIDVRLSSVDLLIEKKEFEKASQELDGVKKINATHPMITQKEALIAVGKNDYQKSVEHLNAYLKEKPSDFNLRFKRAEMYFELSKYESAVQDLKWTTDQNPNHLPSLVLMLDCQIKKKDFKEADRLAKQYRNRFPENRDLLSQQGEISLALGKNDEAVLTYKKILELEPLKAEAAQKLTQIYIKNNKPVLLEEEYTRQLKVNPESDVAAEGLVDLWIQQKRVEQAGGFLKKYVERFPGKVWALKKYTHLLYSIGEKDLAYETTAKTVKKTKPTAEHINFAVWVYTQNGKNSEAVDLMEDYASEFPQDEFLAYTLGTIYEKNNQTGKALKAYGNVPEKSAAFVKSQWAQVALLEKTNENAKALGILRKMNSESDPQVKNKIVELEAKTLLPRSISSEKK